VLVLPRPMWHLVHSPPLLASPAVEPFTLGNQAFT
jgi:hypothetical protein